MYSKTPIHPLTSHSNHIILNIKSNQSVKKILRFSAPQNLKQTLNDKPRTLHQLTLKSNPNIPKSSGFNKIIANLKHLKSLKCLDIDIDSLPYDSKSISEFFHAIKHLKDLSVVHLYLIGLETPFLDRKIQPLYRAIKKIRPVLRLEIRLSLSPMNYTSFLNCPILLEKMNRIPRFTSLHLNFSMCQDLSRIERFILPLKNSKSLTRLYFNLDYCKVDDSIEFLSLIGHFQELKSVKNSRISLKNCKDLTYPKLKALAPIIKKVGQVHKLEVIFEDYPKKITPFQWRMFKMSVRTLGFSKKNHAKIQVVDKNKKKVNSSKKANCLTRKRLITIISTLSFLVIMGLIILLMIVATK